MAPESLDWRKDAACADAPNSLWFARSGDSPASIAARAICRGCRVRVACLDFAMDDHDAFSHGIWAGTSPEDRKLLRTQQNAA